ncbi:hypothetical protein TYRP_023092 [Tyrophagus putrescentiae]|nr:hypothetical protein TYRP_023092 [Tyrophagus putrescentiae]
MVLTTYQTKKGNQQAMKAPMMMPNVLAALCSRFILLMVRLVGVLEPDSGSSACEFRLLAIICSISSTAQIRLTGGGDVVVVGRRRRRSCSGGHLRRLLLEMVLVMVVVVVVMVVVLIGHLLRPVDELLLLRRLLEDLHVGHYHNATRDPKADRAAQQRVGNVHVEAAVVGIHRPLLYCLLRRVETGKDGYAADEDGAEPDGADHDVDPLCGDLHRIIERLDDGVVAVVADAAEVHDAGGAEEHVAAVPEVAHPPGEDPVAGEDDAGVEGHREDRHQDVRQRQRDDEVVGGDAQASSIIVEKEDEEEDRSEEKYEEDEAPAKELSAEEVAEEMVEAIVEEM